MLILPILRSFGNNDTKSGEKDDGSDGEMIKYGKRI